MSTTQLHDGPYFFKPLTDEIQPLEFQLPGQETRATAYPVYAANQVHESLVEYMWKEFNYVVEEGQTYPQAELLTKEEFIDYWFHSFCVIVVQKEMNIQKEHDWGNAFLGTFYIKPNYMARCSHNCNAGFLVNHLKRGKKIGFRLAQIYLKWAPLLGYKYSVFNLVFVTNVASWKLWDKFKFDRIGLLPRGALLKGHEEPVDAIIYGRDLTKVDPILLEGLSSWAK
ncbi:(ZYRO0F07062g) [Zygosaccharomyces parabailii]|uniref:ZYBA0S09-03444g1_1 n=1 Tax=Zygosaccharomyces bailii (strain CLIB 213 / ATCC 58445 / CBS 680 / BCRC 21525 / NBRC 1098 / NCYC 1416 / NRRL Y-2227) TaxID=1333698 RepID=A0A8J2XA89_ZYGB2|nr:(ZYRO0F07062g) [Zygosaccharomyces parabailii]CDF91039.1 ZYBA0S09-03444g1_1 [Zygosaccharomyces bailii CLIB 213]CDH14063.1 related to histone acetyltransferase HPA2 and related acetyltransferases [Zygosaccharomyces bailii ISA1307]